MDVGQVPQERRQQDRKALLARIPAFPPIVLRLLNLLGQDEVEIRDIVALISSDPALSAHVLRMANSPLFGFRSQIDSLQWALLLLGLRRVRVLAMTVATASHMQAALKIEELSRCWRHMLACALLTEEMARACSQFEDRAYTAGLMHDLGRLGLLLANPAEYAEMLRDADRNSLDVLECEKASMGMDHCEAGRALAAEWNLPLDLQVIAARHHDPQDNYQLDLLTLVHLACKLADSLGFWVVRPLQPRSVEEIQAELPPLLKSRIHIDEARWRELLDRRVNCYAGSATPAGEELRDGSALEAPEVLDLPAEEPAMENAPDRERRQAFIPEFLQPVAIGVLAVSIVAAVVYFAKSA
jgi:HD-like signal output (HDOD) protein